jgi:hypothetical protein
VTRRSTLASAKPWSTCSRSPEWRPAPYPDPGLSQAVNSAR